MRIIRKCLNWPIYGHRWIYVPSAVKWLTQHILITDNMNNTILLYKYWIHNIESEYSMEYDPIRFSTANIIVSGTVLFQFVVIVIDETFCIDAFMYEMPIWMRIIRKCLNWPIYGHRWIYVPSAVKWLTQHILITG
jgi:hypothetical protein